MNKMIKHNRTFSEKEIEKWNEIFEKACVYFKLIPIQLNSAPFFNIEKRWESDSSLNQWDKLKKAFTDFKKSEFKYRFSFSVSKIRYKEFFDMVNSFAEDGFYHTEEYTKVTTEELKEAISRFTSLEHTVLKTPMVKVQYDFKTNPLVSMMVVTIIEDAISFFQKIWGYNENGEELSIIDFPIGSLVSIKSEKGSEFIVNNLIYHRVNSIVTYERIYGHNQHHSHMSTNTDSIIYELVKINGQTGSNILTYGDVYLVREDEICPSRSNNLDIILN